MGDTVHGKEFGTRFRKRDGPLKVTYYKMPSGIIAARAHKSWTLPRAWHASIARVGNSHRQVADFTSKEEAVEWIEMNLGFMELNGDFDASPWENQYADTSSFTAAGRAMLKAAYNRAKNA